MNSTILLSTIYVWPEYTLDMASYVRTSLKRELKKALSRPWWLPRNLFISAIGTLGWIIISIHFHLFHKGLPYAAAEVFIWTLASYNASQLGSDSETVLKYTKQKRSLKELFILKNSTLLIFSIPVDIILISLACWFLGDWSRFWLAIPLAIVAVIISLGLGNIVSVAWVYKRDSLWKIRRNRLKIADYVIFVTLSYIAATLGLYLAVIPGNLLLHVTNLHSFSSVIFGLFLIFVWAIICWVVSLRLAERLAARYHGHFIGRLSGELMQVNNARLKKLLKLN